MDVAEVRTAINVASGIQRAVLLDVLWTGMLQQPIADGDREEIESIGNELAALVGEIAERAQVVRSLVDDDPVGFGAGAEQALEMAHASGSVLDEASLRDALQVGGWAGLVADAVDTLDQLARDEQVVLQSKVVNIHSGVHVAGDLSRRWKRAGAVIAFAAGVVAAGPILIPGAAIPAGLAAAATLVELSVGLVVGLSD